MLSDAEKKGCIQLLNKLTDDEIISLKDTITNRLVAAENRNEAMRAILEYSQSALELLRRKKIRRDLIFQYLADCGVVVPVTTEKHELIRRALEFWGSSMPQQRDLTEEEWTTEIAERPPTTTVVHSPTSPSLQQRLAETFVRWFYQILNAENPSYTSSNNGATADDRFGPHHFWDNCTLRLVSRAPDLNRESFQGSGLVAQRLQALMREEGLILNPNVSGEGVRVQSNPHGLLVVMACGTIHQDRSCLGVFEQVFGLVRNPLNENNWRVKVTELHLSSGGGGGGGPRLTDDSASELLAIAGSLAVAIPD